jgi:glycosyltransferase involved in cell wall biosynthesis
MKIHHVINDLVTGGAERLVVELSKGMRDLGHDVTIVQLTASPKNSPIAHAATEAGLDVVVLGRHRFDPRLIWRVRKQTRQADIVHAHLFPAFYLVSLLGHRTKVLTEHSTDNRRRHRALLRRLDRATYRRFDRCVAISDGVNRSLTAYLGSLGVSVPCVTIENGIRLAEYSTQAPASRDRTLKLITIGSLDSTKNVTEAIEAVAGVIDVSLTVVGEGPLRSALEAQVDSNNQRHQVTFLGIRSDVPELLRKHHALMMTSVYEGFGLVAVEAMAAHVPVLAPDILGLGQIVGHGDGGLLHPSHDVGQLRAHVEQLRDDENYRRQLALGAHDRSRAFDVASCIDQHLNMYESLTKAKSARPRVITSLARPLNVDGHGKEET